MSVSGECQVEEQNSSKLLTAACHPSVWAVQQTVVRLPVVQHGHCWLLARSTTQHLELLYDNILIAQCLYIVTILVES